MKTRTLIYLLILTVSMLIPTCFPCIDTGDHSSAFAADKDAVTAVSDLKEINQFGNATLMKEDKNLTPDDLKAAGIEYGDVVTVSFLDQKLKMPVVNNYDEVGTGVMLIRLNGDTTEIAINMGDFASEYFADKSTFEDETFEWTYKKGIQGPVEFTITLKTKGGYYDEYGSEELTYSDKRSDYPDLSDEEFANFRVVDTDGMGKDVLYRTASPINPEHNRNTYADAAIKKAAVVTVMNLADSEEAAKAFPGFDESYYSSTDFIALDMGVDFSSEDFENKLAEGLRFFAENEGPYAVHCTEGKDRAGAVSALLECFMGATYEEVINDYMVTYYNYYGIKPGDKDYDKIADENIVATLQKMFDTDDLKAVDLAASAESYFLKIGLKDTEIEALRTNLGGAEPVRSMYILLAVAVVAAALICVMVVRRKKGHRS